MSDSSMTDQHQGCAEQQLTSCSLQRGRLSCFALCAFSFVSQLFKMQPPQTFQGAYLNRLLGYHLHPHGGTKGQHRVPVGQMSRQYQKMKGSFLAEYWKQKASAKTTLHTGRAFKEREVILTCEMGFSTLALQLWLYMLQYVCYAQGQLHQSGLTCCSFYLIGGPLS